MVLKSSSWWLGLLALAMAADAGHRVLSFAAGPFPLIADAIGYWHSGLDMAAGDLFLLRHPNAFRPPLYPAYLALCQFCFGNEALIAAVVGQHLMGMATSLVVGWSCRKLTGSNTAFLAGYVLSALCIGRVQYAQLILSETLFILTLSLHLAAFVAWHCQASRRNAVLLGLSLGLCILVRPVAQWLWVPELAFLLLRRSASEGLLFRERLFQGAAYLCVVFLLVVPWILRNRIAFGETFFTQSQGRHLWVACFSARAADLPLPDEQTTERLKGIDYREEWDVYGVLTASGLSEVEADRWMLAVCARSLRQRPLRFVERVLGNCFVFWWAGNEGIPWTIRYNSMKQDNYFGQRTWCFEQPLRPFNAPFRFIYRYPGIVLGAAGAASFLGALALLTDPVQRRAAQFLLLLLLYFTFVTALVQEPRYRYRMILDPVAVVAVVAGTWAVCCVKRASVAGPIPAAENVRAAVGRTVQP